MNDAHAEHHPGFRRVVLAVITMAMVATGCTGDAAPDATPGSSDFGSSAADDPSMGTGEATTSLTSAPTSPPTSAPTTAQTTAPTTAPTTGSVSDPPSLATLPTLGVTDDEILVAYYWRGDALGASQFFGDQDTLVPQEAEAFAAYVNYLNENSGTGATFLGFPFDLHGRTIRGVIIEGGRTPEQFAAVAESIASEIQPFATVAGEGSISAYACPRLAEAGIFSVATLAIEYDMVESSNGYCLPMHQSWETQVGLVSQYVGEQSQTPFVGSNGESPRVYGLAYTEHPGLVSSIDRLVADLEAAGATIAEVATLPADLTTAQQQAANVIARFRAAGVNTVIFPEAGTPLTLTRAAQAQEFEADYVIWPCAGMDLAGMGHLFPPAQWSRAAGVSCYDADFNVDIARDDTAADAVWYQQYKEGSEQDTEPPLNTELVYLGMLPLVVGITNAGPDLTAESFLAGLEEVEPYRWSAFDGRTDNPDNMLISFRSPTYSPIGDGVGVRWDEDFIAPGSTLPGGLRFDDHRISLNESS